MVDAAAPAIVADNIISFKNNVLHYIHKNAGRAGDDTIIRACKEHFQDKAIADARQYLLTDCKIILSDIDNILLDKLNKLTKRRRNSDKRDCTNAYLLDIINIMKSLQGNDIVVDIIPNKDNEVPSGNPESLTTSALNTRVDIQDTHIEKLTNDIKQIYNSIKKTMKHT